MQYIISLAKFYLVILLIRLLFYYAQNVVAGFDGQLLSLALSYTMTISYVILDYILWSSAEVETYVSFILIMILC